MKKFKKWCPQDYIFRSCKFLVELIFYFSEQRGRKKKLWLWLVYIEKVIQIIIPGSIKVLMDVKVHCFFTFFFFHYDYQRKVWSVGFVIRFTSLPIWNTMERIKKNTGNLSCGPIFLNLFQWFLIKLL